MFADFLRRLTEPAVDPLTEGDSRLALTALLVRIARSDEDYQKSEIELIDSIVAERYGLSADDASALRHDAEQLEAEAPDTVKFTTAIKQGVAYEHRLGVIESLWKVVLADGKRDEAEDALLRTVSRFLGVSDMDSALARQRVQGG